MAAIFDPVVFTDYLSEYIDHALMEGRPHIRGRRMPVYILAQFAAEQKWDIKRLAQEFTLSEAEVIAALLYYEQHQAEIDAQQAAIEEKYTPDDKD